LYLGNFKEFAGWQNFFPKIIIILLLQLKLQRKRIAIGYLLAKDVGKRG
jgi:hypothetical protein